MIFLTKGKWSVCAGTGETCDSLRSLPGVRRLPVETLRTGSAFHKNGDAGKTAAGACHGEQEKERETVLHLELCGDLSYGICTFDTSSEYFFRE